MARLAQAHEVALARENDIPDVQMLLKKLATNIIVKNLGRLTRALCSLSIMSTWCVL